jgi:Protein of unknown function (DUF2786)
MTKERDSILSKIRALLAKTLEAGATEPEAMAALEKAQAMRDAHQVTEEELNLTKEEKAVLRGEPRGTKDPHLIKWQLLYGVTKFCGCHGWKRAGVRSGGGGIVFCGLPADVQFATWLLDHFGRLGARRASEPFDGCMPRQARPQAHNQGLCLRNMRTD